MSPTGNNGMPGAAGDRLLRWRAVHEKTGLSRTTTWRLIRKGAFPAARRISENGVAWLASEIDAWITTRAAVRSASHDTGAPANGGRT